MSDLMNGTDVPWDAVSGPVEARGLTAPRMTPPLDVTAAVTRAVGMMRPAFENMARAIIDATKSIVPIVATAAADARRDLLDGDHLERDEIRADITVAQMQALAPFAERGES